MTDYTNKSHNVYANASYRAGMKWLFFTTIAFNKSTAKYDEVNMPDPTSRLFTSDGLVPEMTHSNFDYSGVPGYSDLDYQLVRFSLGAEYSLTPAIALTLDGDYADLMDDAAYVYGDESGSYFLVRWGARFKF